MDILRFESKNVWKELSNEELEQVYDYGQRYMDFLDNAKTERLATDEIIRLAEEKGFMNFDDVVKNGNVKTGDKYYLNNHNKSVVLMILGEDLEEGMNIVGAHVDAPRLDLKALPLYEEGNMALLKTHYYGGVKKYQWTCIPLAIHGVIFTKDGKKVNISIGEDDNDPVLYINDLLIHLSADQMKKTLAEGVTGEQLNVVIGSSAANSDSEDKEPVKSNILKLLNEKYGIVEEDFQVAELEIVPAGKSRHVGLDRSMIAAHGHDDRVCSFAGVDAILNIENPSKTVVGLFVDKEEIGSVGNTSMDGLFFENMIAEILHMQNKTPIVLRRSLANSKVLSGDVNVGFDPSFPEVLDSMNAAKIGHGVSISKYTGSRGKGGCNDANAEFIADLRNIFNSNDVIWQTGELGKVDQGGGGTIAYILAKYGAQVIDCGTPMLSMHAPMELLSKADAYMTMKAYKAFLQS
ncbi:MAG: aminopeptidase [Tissierellia bacterium]|nr:aminopeptidase [Tissierellia bacterium]